MALISIVGETQVLEACDRLVDFSVWPRRKIDYRTWLDNFDRADRPIAVHMLSRFTFFSHELVDQLFRSAFQNLSNVVIPPSTSATVRRDLWTRFTDEAIIVPLMGEEPNVSDSGFGFARKARQLLGIAEERLLQPAQAVALIASGGTSPVVFVDDFVGSGDQFLKTWRHIHDGPAGPASFAALSNGFTACYCNVLTTEYGRSRIRAYAPSVAIASGNIIPRDHNFAAWGSAMWPKGLAVAGAKLAKRIGAKLGYTKNDGSLRDWRGFHRLALGIAMEDSVPDANLPLFFEDAAGWRPLVRRA
jgi:hypothetical protein